MARIHCRRCRTFVGPEAGWSADKMTQGADGSITIYIQADSPGKDKELNWLPAPKEPFYMLFRMYLPDIEVLNGQYELPGVQQVK